MSKGSKRRPINPAIERQVFEDNWNRIFNKSKQDFNYESDNPLERPFEPSGVWHHQCKNNGSMSVEKGQACNWCGLKEDGSLD